MEVQRLPVDVIDTLPQTIIESILCLMPIRDAVRTSILSRKWRYNWVNIPKLVFDDKQLFKVSANMDQLSKTRNLFYTIYQVLLLHHGPILEFTLTMFVSESCSEIDHIILHLLRNNTVKKFTLVLLDSIDYKLSSSFFSLKQLTHLDLYGCELKPPSTFIGFCSLTSLRLEYVKITPKMLLHLVSICPLLKSFTLFQYDDFIENKGYSTIIELFECLPLIEHLGMNCYAIECFAVGGVPQRLPTSLAHLKYVDLLMMDMNEIELSFTFLLIRSSPKLEEISIQIDTSERLPQLLGIIKHQDYSDVWLDHLTELEIVNFGFFMPELEFVKLILVKSTVLKKVHIRLDSKVSSEEELKMSRTLLCLPRASPLVQIIVTRPLTS